MVFNITPTKDQDTNNTNIILRDFQDVNLRGHDLELNEDGTGSGGVNVSPTGSLKSTSTAGTSGVLSIDESTGSNDDSSHHDQLPSIDDVIMNNLKLGGGRGGKFSIRRLLQTRRHHNRKFALGVVIVSLIVLFTAVIGLIVHITRATRAETSQGLLVNGGDVDNNGASEPYTANVLTRTGQIMSLVSGTLSEPNDVIDGDSPQHEAIAWLADVDPYQIDIPTSLVKSENENPSADIDAFIQRYAIITLTMALGGRDILSEQVGFLDGQHECRWHHRFERQEDDTTLRMGLTCDENDVVEKIVLQTLGLDGNLPREIGLLTHLNTLRLDDNNITSLLPMYMKHCSELEVLSLTMNHFHGTIPDWVGTLTNLQEFQLSYNNMRGEIPVNFDALTDMSILALDHNNFHGGAWVDTINQLINLRELYLNHNSFAGHLHPRTFSELSHLMGIDLSMNKILGQFPGALFTLPNIQLIDVHDNAINGPMLPEDNSITIPEDCRLRYLDIHENFIEGSIPVSIANMQRLEHLDFSTNRFNKGSALPNSMKGLTQLQYIYMEDNTDFEPSQIPHWLHYFENLKEISLMDTSLTGPIPNAFGYLPSLELLNLGLNSLNSTVPESLGDAFNLRYLLLNKNKLTGEVPTEIGQLDRLKVFMLDHNELTGEISEEICAVANTNMDVMIADCGDTADECTDCFFTEPQIQCTCCTECCTYDESGCNAGNYMMDTYFNDWGDPYLNKGEHVFTDETKNVKYQPIG